MHLAYQAADHELAAKTLDFSPSSIRDRWAAGRRDMASGLALLEGAAAGDGRRFEYLAVDPRRRARRRKPERLPDPGRSWTERPELCSPLAVLGTGRLTALPPLAPGPDHRRGMLEEQAGTPEEEARWARLAALEAENARLGCELEAARRDAARFRTILGSAADYAIFTLDPDLRVTSWNAGAENLLGWDEAEALGMDSALLFTPEDRERCVPGAETAMAAAEGRAGNERWHVRKDGGQFWGSGLMMPLRDGHDPGFLKVMRDRTARREGDERQRLLLQELAHRVKNSLAVVLSMARQTGGRAADLTSFLEDFNGRIRALAAVHDLLSENGWLGTSLSVLVRAALAPHDDGRIRAEVEDLPLEPAAAQSLVMALHELATNAAKHGALSTAGGTVSLEARSEDGELVVAWREEGGPPVSPPASRGFGSTLLEQVVAHQHGGRLELDWRPEGLVCTIRLPLVGVAARTEVPGKSG